MEILVHHCWFCHYSRPILCSSSHCSFTRFLHWALHASNDPNPAAGLLISPALFLDESQSFQFSLMTASMNYSGFSPTLEKFLKNLWKAPRKVEFYLYHNLQLSLEAILKDVY